MNQILITKFEQKYKKLKQFKGVLFVSIIAIAIFISIYVAYKFQLKKEKIFSENMKKIMAFTNYMLNLT